MPDFELYRQGLPIRGISARDMNRFARSTKITEGMSTIHRSPPGVALRPYCSTLLVSNASGNDLDIGEIVKLGNPIPTIDDNPDAYILPISFEGDEPDDDTEEDRSPWAVLTRGVGADDDEMIVAIHHGYCWAKVNFGAEDHLFAAPASGSHILESTMIYGARVLYKPSGTGELMCVIELPAVYPEWKGVATSVIASGATGGTAEFYTGAPGSEAGTGDEYDVVCYLLNTGETIADEARLLARRIDGKNQVVGTWCEA